MIERRGDKDHAPTSGDNEGLNRPLVARRYFESLCIMNIRRRLVRCGACDRSEGASVPDLQRRDRPTHWQSSAANERLCGDSEARQSRGHHTAYLKNVGTLEQAAQMANHASTRTRQLYDRREEEITLDEVERILV